MRMKIGSIFAVALAVIAGCKYGVGESAARVSEKWAALTALPCVAAPGKAELLDESGSLALFSGETAEDSVSNNDPNIPYSRNSLFLRRRATDGTDEWRLILTTGSNWREATGMSKWCSFQASDLKNNFYIRKAKFGLDRRHLWLVCDTGIPFWDVVCSYDVQKDEFRALIDGFSLEEQSDGTLLVHGKKSYPDPDDGHGAIWRDVWINLNGKILRKGEITLRGSDL